MADSWASDVVPTGTLALAHAKWEQDRAVKIEANPVVTVTEKRQIIVARRPKLADSIETLPWNHEPSRLWAQ